MAGRGFRERRFTAGGANTAHHYTSLARTVHPEGRRRHRRTAAGLAELRDQQLTPPPLLPPVRVRLPATRCACQPPNRTDGKLPSACRLRMDRQHGVDRRGALSAGDGRPLSASRQGHHRARHRIRHSKCRKHLQSGTESGTAPCRNASHRTARNTKRPDKTSPFASCCDLVRGAAR